MVENQVLDARMLYPGDGYRVARLWSRFLPPEDTLDSWLPTLLDELLRKKRVHGCVICGDEGQAFGVGLSCFLRSETVDAFVQSPEPYLNLRLLKQYRAGADVFLSPEDQIPFNTGAGLELFILEYCQATFDFDEPLAHQILNAIVPLYHEVHAGYNIRRALHETEIAVGHIQEAGGNHKQFDVNPQHPHSMSANGLGARAVYGVSRDNADALPATAISKVLLYHAPAELKLTLREQAVVLCALDGQTDVEIASSLGISRDGVRSRWNSIYAHIQDMKPDFFGETEYVRAEATRGPERRRATLSYLKSRPQELRPLTVRRQAAV